jgi:hypothetical protein
MNFGEQVSVVVFAWMMAATRATLRIQEVSMGREYSASLPGVKIPYASVKKPQTPHFSQVVAIHGSGNYSCRGRVGSLHSSRLSCRNST